MGMEQTMYREGYGFVMSVLAIQSISYWMALWRWVTADHVAFCGGFKELIWALTPVLNVFYVRDWWVDMSLFPVKLITSVFRPS
jgi:hypothetical protein